jgi:hypothetical protein
MLPKGFVKIRRFGIYNHTSKKANNLEFINNEAKTLEFCKKLISKETPVEKVLRLTGFNISQCPYC